MFHFNLFHHSEDHNPRRKRVVQAFGDDDQWVLAEQPTEEQLEKIIKLLIQSAKK
jgi:hypothetical protein